MKHCRIICLASLAALLGVASSLVSAQDSTNRPATQVQNITLPGVPNFCQVTTNLYRGAQPTSEGFKQLKAMGIKTVISLREFHSDDDLIAGSGLNSIQVKMSPLKVTEDEVVEFLKAATDTNNVPVFVHCERGSDRTGAMCAMYRIMVCGWTKQQALDEMKHGGFDFSPVWQGLVAFVQNADVADIKRRAGLDAK